ncbi:MAG: DNA polymerase III subunit beta [Thermoguttaceae bacterium]|nr:DNA polymerase III subunit beta [Thermoguttaceae bacterium]
MKVHCERDKLLPAFQLAASVVPNKSPKPILQSVKLALRDQKAVLLATDLEIGICVELSGVTVEEAGEVMLPVGRFGPLLRECTADTICIETEGTQARVSYGANNWLLSSGDPDEFPEIAQFQEANYLKMPVRFFRELIKRTVFATDTESGRYALGGVLFELDDQKFHGVATDGRRLARQDGPVQWVGEPQTISNTIVPSRSLQVLDRSFTDLDEEVHLAIRANDLLIQTGRVTMYTRLLEGRFPRWRDIFPDDTTLSRLDLPVGEFYSAVRQAAIVIDETHPGVEFEFNEGKAILRARSSETGESHVEMPISYDGPTIQISLDPKFLNDFLRVLNADSQVTLLGKDADTPLVLRTEDEYSYIVMPLT